MREHHFRPERRERDGDRVLILDPRSEKWIVVDRAALDKPPWVEWEWEDAREVGDSRDRYIAGYRRPRRIECLRCGQSDVVNYDGNLCLDCHPELAEHKGVE